MAVLLVVTEHVTYLDAAAKRRYEGVRRRLERAGAAQVRTAHYEDVGSLGRVDAVVLSGSRAPWAEHEPDALERLGTTVRAYDGPVLGICAGMQLQALFAGGSVRTAWTNAEESYRVVEVLDDRDLLRGVPASARFYERHTDEVVELPAGFRVLARSSECAVEAIADPSRRWWGTQFHPEHFTRAHPAGERVLRNFFELARG